MREITIQKKDGAKQDSAVIWEGKFEIPDKGDWEAWEELLGVDKMDDWLVDKFEIAARAKHDPRREHRVREPGLRSVKKELEAAGMTYEDLIKFIREQRGK
jgi:predicted DNA binding CopG/RHH family protein